MELGLRSGRLRASATRGRALRSHDSMAAEGVIAESGGNAFPSQARPSSLRSTGSAGRAPRSEPAHRGGRQHRLAICGQTFHGRFSEDLPPLFLRVSSRGIERGPWRRSASTPLREAIRCPRRSPRSSSMGSARPLWDASFDDDISPSTRSRSFRLHSNTARCCGLVGFGNRLGYRLSRTRFCDPARSCARTVTMTTADRRWPSSCCLADCGRCPSGSAGSLPTCTTLRACTSGVPGARGRAKSAQRRAMSWCGTGGEPFDSWAV